VPATGRWAPPPPGPESPGLRTPSRAVPSRRRGRRVRRHGRHRAGDRVRRVGGRARVAPNQVRGDGADRDREGEHGDDREPQPGHTAAGTCRRIADIRCLHRRATSPSWSLIASGAFGRTAGEDGRPSRSRTNRRHATPDRPRTSAPPGRIRAQEGPDGVVPDRL
jgi:hypothetical protein